MDLLTQFPRHSLGFFPTPLVEPLNPTTVDKQPLLPKPVGSIAI